MKYTGRNSRMGEPSRLCVECAARDRDGKHRRCRPCQRQAKADRDLARLVAAHGTDHDCADCAAARYLAVFPSAHRPVTERQLSGDWLNANRLPT